MTAITPIGPFSPTRCRRWMTDAKAQIYRRFRMGVSAEVLARQYGRTRSSIYRLINEMRARRHSRDASSNSSTTPASAIPARPPRSSGPMPEPADGKAPRRPKAPKGLAAVPGQPLRGSPPGPRTGDAPVPQDELPETPGQRDPLEDRSQPGQDRPTSTRSNGCRKKRWPSRTRSSGPTCGWWSRSPSGTSARRTTSSSWCPTATCR